MFSLLVSWMINENYFAEKQLHSEGEWWQEERKKG